MSDVIKQMYDEDGNRAFPVTHVDAVKDSNGTTLPDILDRDYPTTSKTPVEGSTEVSLVTRGEKYDYDKVNNATDVSGASGIGADFKYLLLNGTTGEFEKALESYVNEKVRSAIGSLINNLDKGTGVKAVAGIDNNNDLGTITPANLASLLGVNKKTTDAVAQGQEGLVQMPTVSGFIFARDGFWNGHSAIWYYNVNRLAVIYEESNSVLSASNASAKCYCTAQVINNVSYIKIKNNHTDAVRFSYRFFSL